MASIKQTIEDLKNNQELKDKIYTIIFGTDTPAGKLFDVVLIAMISLSVLLIIMDSFVAGVDNVEHPYVHIFFRVLEYVFQVFFICEFLLRIYSHPRPKEYVFSFFGIVDLLSIIPLGYNTSIRALRIIRVFRVFKMLDFLEEGHELLVALKKSMNKIIVFFIFVLILNTCMGSLLWTMEYRSNPDITNVLEGIYCSIITMTTVGYGDVTPVTGTGKFLTSIMMLMGYTIVAIPTGIVSAEMVREKSKRNKFICPSCGKTKHKENAKFCDICGTKLEAWTSKS